LKQPRRRISGITSSSRSSIRCGNVAAKILKPLAAPLFEPVLQIIHQFTRRTDQRTATISRHHRLTKLPDTQFVFTRQINRLSAMRRTQYKRRPFRRQMTRRGFTKPTAAPLMTTTLPSIPLLKLLLISDRLLCS